MHRLLSALTLLSAFTVAAQGQSSANVASPKFPPEAAEAVHLQTAVSEEWDGAVTGSGHSKIFVVLLSNLKHRDTCRIANVSSDRLTCEATAFRPQKTYRRSEIAALIQPASHTHAGLFIGGWFATGAGLITAACLLGPVTLGASIPIGIVGAFFVITTPAAAMVTDAGDSPESFLYRSSIVTAANIRLHN